MNGEKQIGRTKAFFSRGGGGILAVAVIILIFLLCATWLKSLIFGILLACLLLPLEHFYEDHVFMKRERKGLIRRVRERFSGKKLSDAEEKKLLRQQKIFKASLSSFRLSRSLSE